MAKVKATLADVSTEYEPIPPDTYEMEVESVEENELDNGRISYVIKSKVVEPGDDSAGKPVYDRIYIHKRDGSVNEYALVELKRYFEAIVGEERANAGDLDTDELLHGRFLGDVIIDSWETDDGEERQSNKFKRVAPLA